MLVTVDTGREEKALSQVRERLVNAYGETHSADRVDAVVGAARKRFEGHKIREFVPILVERIVRRELEPRTGDEVTERITASVVGANPDAGRINSEPSQRNTDWRTLARDKRVLGGLAAAIVVVLAVAVALGTGGDSETVPGTGATSGATTIRGVVGSEKSAFFEDPRVGEVLARHGVKVEVDPAGSRQIATTVDLAKYDFAFPSSAPAAERIQRQSGVSGKYTPFSSPMAIATFTPIVELLTRAGIVTPGPVPTFDVEKFLALAERGVQWDQLADNTVYPVRKNVLVSTTDPRTSSSAAMYLAAAAYVANDNTIVRGTAAEEHAVSRVSRLFTRQGYTENSSDGPFKEYLSSGMGPTPMVWIYEAQFVEAAAHGQLKPDMVLMYPSPTVLSQHTVVPLNDSGDRLGKLLTTDPDLQKLAAEHGFRTADPTQFTQVAGRYQVPVTPQLIDVIDPPDYETLEHLLDGVAKSYN
ncbi:three-helix bundle dimerization domain-containing protein [Nocardia sp. NPDC050406]|uniref:three-helix bundle dimerization domain-containing protein n=1 Tax=Nocardia sp. NPDC050406 TaxID=3364318 RepID=UPI003793392A